VREGAKWRGIVAAGLRLGRCVAATCRPHKLSTASASASVVHVPTTLQLPTTHLQLAAVLLVAGRLEHQALLLLQQLLGLLLGLAQIPASRGEFKRRQG